MFYVHEIYTKNVRNDVKETTYLLLNTLSHKPCQMAILIDKKPGLYMRFNQVAHHTYTTYNQKTSYVFLSVTQILCTTHAI